MRLSSVLGLIVALVIGFAATAVRAEDPSQPLRAGIIGTTTSHVPAFAKALNDPNAQGPLADVEVVAGFMGGIEDNPSSWGRREKFAQDLRDLDCTIYDTIDELLANVDVIFLEEVDGRPHLEWAKQVIAAKKPLFIDKPIAGSLADALEIFRLANEAGVPCFSSSSLRFVSGFQAARRGEPFGDVVACTAWSPMSLESHHPDLFWYGIHGVESLFTVMGTGCKSVIRVADDKVVGVWEDGRVGTYVAYKGYGALVLGKESNGSVGSYEGYKPMLVEICKFFKTGKPPVAQEETIEIYTFMEAADQSKRADGVPVSMKEVLEKAQAKNAARTK